MKLARHHFAIAAAVLFAVVGFLIFRAGSASAESTKPEEEVQQVATVRVERGPMAETVSVSGEFRPWEEVDLHAKVAGYVSKIRVDVGDRVKQGQELAILEVPELSAQLSGAVANTHRSEQAIRRAQSDVIRAQSAHEAAHYAFERLRSASEAKPGLIAQQELDDARAKDLETQAQVTSAEAALSESQQQLDVSKASHQQLSAEAAYAHIYAPFDGVITHRYADPGALIQAGTNSATQTMPVVKVANVSMMRLTVPVPESAVGALRVGDVATVHVPSVNCLFNGRIARFSESLDQQTRTMYTEIDVPNPDGDLVTGMYATVDFSLQSKSSALTLPVNVVARSGDKATVWKLDSKNEVREQTVTLGVIGQNRVEIVAGLSPNDQVVIGNRSQFHSGERVSPRPFVQPSSVPGGSE